jgi:Subtilase family
VAPGEADWALCTPNPALYEECTDFKGNPGQGAPASLEQFGGTSQSTPLTAGAAALVIEAYRNTHKGATPAPALVKRILTSTANDLGFPSREQGAGEVDSLKAVQEAMSIDGGTPTGHSLLLNPAKLTIVGRAGSSSDQTVSVTNTGATSQTVSARSRALTSELSNQRKDVTLGSTPTFVDQFGSARPYVTTTFTVPAGADRLLASDAWPGPSARVGLTLIDPTGAYAAYTRPQGNGDHGQVDVRDPAAGTWTAIVFLRDGTFTGSVHLSFATQRFGAVDAVSPGSLTLAPGQTGQFHLHAHLSQQPGDSDRDLVISDSNGDQTVVPVDLRSLVAVDAHGGSFTGTLTGGNGRPGPAEEQTFAFDVPKGAKSLSTAFAFADDVGTEVLGFLVDPDGDLLASQSTGYAAADGSLVQTNGLRAVTVAPRPGRWKFIMLELNPVGGNTLSAPFRGRVSFDAPAISAKDVPNGDKLVAGTPVTATLTVHNDGPGTEDVFADPRLNEQSLLPVLPISQATNLPLPIPGDVPAPTFIVPTQTDRVLSAAEATAPILLEMGFGVFGEGDPDILGQSSGKVAAAAYSAPEVANGPWFLAPAMRGPFDSAASGAANVGMAGHTKAFDHATQSSTGDIWQQTVDDGQTPSDYTPLTLKPGQSGKITVTFTPRGKHGATVQGILYVDDFSFRTLTGNEQLAIPYSYKIR